VVGGGVESYWGCPVVTEKRGAVRLAVQLPPHARVLVRKNGSQECQPCPSTTSLSLIYQQIAVSSEHSSGAG